jgi:hypothetical protein
MAKTALVNVKSAEMGATIASTITQDASVVGSRRF